MQLNAYLVFNGQCEAAFKFYEKVLGGKILGMFTHAGTAGRGATCRPEWLNKIMHVTPLKVGDNVLMGSDVPPDRYTKPQGIHREHRPRAMWQRRNASSTPSSENGTVGMPIAADLLGRPAAACCTDRFGIPWMVNCETGVRQ